MIVVFFVLNIDIMMEVVQGVDQGCRNVKCDRLPAVTE